MNHLELDTSNPSKAFQQSPASKHTPSLLPADCAIPAPSGLTEIQIVKILYNNRLRECID